MFIRAQKFSRSLLAFCAMGFCSLTAQAQSDLYTLSFSSDRVQFTLGNFRFQDSGVNLKVSGPNDYSFEQTFPSTRQFAFSIYNNRNSVLPDGNYTYQVTILGSPRERSDDDFSGETREELGLRQGGTFSIQSGVLQSPNLEEVGAVRDQTFNDDVIVLGSICAGLDCVNGESFGFDTVRLKENNLRIRFVDTSASASFPSTDWELRANDTTNGGANKFTIADVTAGREVFTVEGGAPESSLYVDDRGRVGVGTNTPLLDMHILSGNTPSTRYEQDGSGGFPSQTWDVGGNEAEFFIRDSNSRMVPFSIEPGAPSDSLVINSAGNIEIGGSIVMTRDKALPTQKLSQAGQLDLLPLDQLGAHIKRYQQLPGIDADNTADMLAFQMQLLEKIQELTLYTLQQEQRIKELEETVSNLNQKK